MMVYIFLVMLMLDSFDISVAYHKTAVNHGISNGFDPVLH